jgi:hypothetical protein
MGLEEDLHDKMVKLAENLLAGTRSGNVAWTPTDSDDKYLCTGTRSSVTIESFIDRDGDRISVLSLLNSHGSVVESLQSRYVSTESNYTAESWNESLDDLFYSARRVAYSVDDAIDSLLADIEKGISAPEPRQKRGFGSKPDPDPWSSDSGYSDEPPF